VDYQFDFGPVFAHWPELVRGTLLTVWLTVAATVIGLPIAAVLAAARSYGPRPLVALIGLYIELIRNTPFLIQLYFVFFALPGLGLRLSANSAAITAMVVNLVAYAIEIIRAGLESIPRGQIEAGRALGLGPLRILRHIVLVQALRVVYPALASQFVLQLLGSSLVSAIAAEELTAVANNIMIVTFRNFEVFGVVTLTYLALSLLFRTALGGLHRLAFRWTG
jgi:polar amino acid transport system permease protein